MIPVLRQSEQCHSSWTSATLLTQLRVDNRLYLSSSEAFKGCAFSPDATRIAYWTDTKMILYSADTLKESPGNEETPSARYSLDQTDGFWKNAIFTSEHLIAFTTGKNEVTMPTLASLCPWLTWRLVLYFRHCWRLSRVHFEPIRTGRFVRL